MPDVQHPTVAAGPKAERRNLTVLFGDMVGSSALATQLDPEDLREVLRSVQAAFREGITRYDGHVARYLGDGVLAYFGFPVAHEDAAERAVNAALHMVESVSRLSFPNVPPLELHIGIATGLVVVGDLIGEGPSREFELIGEAPNIAARLQSLAEPNQILVSPQTRRLLGKLFEVADIGECDIKGYKRPMRVWRVVRRNVVQSRFDAHRSSDRTPFVGREAELAALHDRYERARSGEGGLVTVSGEPGIGKSRLIAALRDRLAGETVGALLFQCSSYHTSSPWHPVIRHVEDAATIGHDDSASEKLRKLEELVDRYLPGRGQDAVPLLAALLSVPTGDRYPALELTPAQYKRRTLSALLDLLLEQTERDPGILVFEDLHWADPSTLELLELLRQKVAELRILIVCSFRSDFASPWADHADVVAIAIDPLESRFAASMIESLTGGRALPASVVEQVVSKTDGVPLFVEEVTQAVLLGLAASEGSDPTGPQPALAVPDTLHDSLMARLDQLASMKEVAQISAAIGREFDFELLEAVSPFSKDEMRVAVEGLVTSGILLREERRARPAYAFKHALVQDTAYASMLREERRKLHMRIAEALCERFADIAAAAPELVAHHYTRAQETALAIPYWFKAGGQASRRSAFVEATTHFGTALGMLDALPENAERDALELQIQQALASAYIAVRGFGAPETTGAFERALQLCERNPGTPHIFAVLNGLAGMHYLRGNFERARAVAEDLQARALRQSDPTPLLIGHRVLGMSLFAMGELDEACTHLRTAIELYDPPRHAPLALVFAQDFRATAQVYLGLATVLQGDPEGGAAASREALAHAEALRHPHSICYVLPFLAGTLVVAGLPREAHEAADRAVALSAEYGFPQWMAGGLLLRGWARVEMGELESGVADIRSTIDGLERTGTLVWMQFAQLLLAQGLAKLGELRESAQLADRLMAEIKAAEGRWYEAEVHRLKGDLLLAEGAPPAEVERCYEAARSVAARQNAPLWERRASDSLAALRKTYGRDTQEAAPRVANR